MSYCGNCYRDLADWQSSMDCPCRKGIGMRDVELLDKIITLHRPEPDDYSGHSCGGCFDEWPCSTRRLIEKWGSGV